MAIAFLNNIAFSGGAQVQSLRLENLGADPASGNHGQLYYNTSTSKVKVHNGTSWVNLDGANDFLTDLSFDTTNGVLTATVQNQQNVTVDLDNRYLLIDDNTTYNLEVGQGGDNTAIIELVDNFGNTSHLTISGVSNEIEITEDTGDEGSITIGLPDDVTIASQLVVGTNSQTDSPVIHSKTNGGGANLLLESTATGATDSPDLVLFRNTTHTAGDYLGSLKFRGLESSGSYSSDYASIGVIMTSSEAASIVFDSETPNSNRTGLFAIHGETSGSVVVNPSSSTQVPTHTLDVNGDANISSDLSVSGDLTVSGTSQSSFAGQVTIPQTPVADTDAASKHYVDQAVVGSLVYQGGYNPSTNTPDLTTSPNSIKKGWTYTVTASGTFFGEQLRVGDVLIAEQDNPTALANWTAVENNTDLATSTTVGLGNVSAGDDGISVTYQNGTAEVFNEGVWSISEGEGINITQPDPSTNDYQISAENSSATNKGIVIVAAGNGIDVSYSSGTATVSAKSKRLDLNSSVTGVTRAEAGDVTTFTINVASSNVFGTGAVALDVMVEVIGNAQNAGETVYTETGRSGGNITIKFAGSVADGDYQVLLNNVG